eukprot:scaffold1290_cov367-Prasinococcus_capsulatus_cf.AAC.5
MKCGGRANPLADPGIQCPWHRVLDKAQCSSGGVLGGSRRHPCTGQRRGRHTPLVDSEAWAGTASVGTAFPLAERSGGCSQ